MSKASDSGSTRRAFLRLAAAGVPAAAAVTATSGEVAAAEPDPASETIQDTAHVRAYYESARF